MSDRSDAIGLASASSLPAAAEHSAAGFAMNDHVTASTMPRAASARLARRVRSWIGVRIGLRGASPRSNGVIGTLSTPTMRTISSTMSALPCTSVRQDGTAIFTTGPLPAIMKPRWLRMRFISGSGTSIPASRFTSVSGKSITRSSPKALPTTMVLRCRAAAQFQHQPGRHFQSRHHEGRIDAALEAIARIGIDAELAAGLGDVDLVPQRRFDQHVRGLLRTARGLAAHDAGQRFDAMVVGNHADALDRAHRCGRRARAASRRRGRGAPQDARRLLRRRTHAAGGRGRRS